MDEICEPATGPGAGVPDEFPVTLREYAHNTGLDALVERALGVWAGLAERLRSEWAVLEARYRALPID